MDQTPKTMKLLEKSIRVNLFDLELVTISWLYDNTNASNNNNNNKIDSLDFIRIKNFYA